MALKQMVLTAVGPDAPGRVKAITSFLLECGCNLEDNRMAVLAGEFATIVLFSGESAALEKVRAGYQELGQQLDFQFTLRDASPRRQPIDCVIYKLRVQGVDQPGIVYAVSSALAELEVNVQSLESYLKPAAFSGTPMFHFDARLEVPQKTLGALQDALATICDEHNITFLLEPDQAS
jgi:glycine cleavage system transcriptional repressor